MKPIKRVLIIQPYGIGDLLFITPVLRALRLLPSIERVDLLIGSRTEEVICSNPHVDEITPVDKDLFHRQGGWKTFCDALSLGAKLRKKRYDLLLDFSMRGEFGFFGLFFLGIPRRAAFAYKRRAFFHNIRVDLSKGYQDKHVADYCAALAEAAGVPVKDRFLEFYFEDKNSVLPEEILDHKQKRKFKNYAVICPGGGASWGKDAYFKQWPAEKFAELAGKISSASELDGFYILGSASEAELAAELEKKADQPAVSLAGELSLTETAAIMQGARLFIGNDGGLMHLAHALRVPLLAVYGPVPTEIYGPYPQSANAMTFVKEALECRPCYKKFRYKSDCTHIDCLRTLSADEIFKKAAESGFLEANLKHAV